MAGSTTHQSLWLATADVPSYAPLEGPLRTDVLVVGAGLTGLQTAYLLKRAGARVVVIDRHRLGHGVSGHATAKITALHALTYHAITETLGDTAAAAYGAANMAAIEAIASLVEHEQIDCDFVRDEACTYAETRGELEQVEREVEAARRAGLPADYRAALTLPYDTRGGIVLQNQAHFHPVRYLQALAELIDGDGSSVHEQTTALELLPDTVQVRTDRGLLSASHIVVATHFPVFDHGPLSVRVKPRRAYVLAARLAAPPSGMYISAAENYRSVRPQPAPLAGDAYVLAGGEPHHTGEGGDTRLRYGRLLRWVEETFAPEAVDYSWSTQDIWTNDGVPFIGHLKKDQERIWTATGFKGWGMTHSMVAAQIISDGILGHANEWAKTYDPWRRSLLHGTGGMVSQAVNVVDKLIIDKITKHSPTCTHMGCTTQWNEAERSWDCPCHGSRFAEDGEVLNGPAIERLRKPKHGE